MRVFVFTVCSAALLFGADLVKLSEVQIKNLRIETAKVQSKDGGSIGHLSAKIIADPKKEFIVSIPSDGVVQRSFALAGQTVRKGQPLIVVASPQFLTLQREFIQIGSRYDLARLNVQKEQKLLNEGIISEREFLRTKNEFSQLEGDMIEKRSMLKLFGMSEKRQGELLSGKSVVGAITLSSPTAGYLLQIVEGSGSKVGAYEPVARIADIGSVWLEIQVPVAKSQMMRAGSGVYVPSSDAKGRVVLVSSEVDHQSQSVIVRAVMDNSKANLRPGQFVEANIIVKGQSNLTVPKSAVTRERGKPLLFVRTKDGFVAQSIEIMGDDGDSYFVSGVSPDAVVATKGVATLKGAKQGLSGGE